MEDEDGDDTRNYLITKENVVLRQYVPDKYMRVCYFANWAGIKRRDIILLLL